MNSAASEESKFPLFATIRRLCETCWAHFGTRRSHKAIRYALTKYHHPRAFSSGRVQELLQVIASNLRQLNKSIVFTIVLLPNVVTEENFFVQAR
jgi:hypothetical protein